MDGYGGRPSVGEGVRGFSVLAARNGGGFPQYVWETYVFVPLDRKAVAGARRVIEL